MWNQWEWKVREREEINARQQGEKSSRYSYIHLSLNIGITRMPLFRRLYLSASIYTETFGRLPGTRHSLLFESPFSPQKSEGANANGVQQPTTVKSGKEFLTFCQVSSRCQSMSLASFGNWDSAQSAATPSFFTASRSLSLSDGMKSGCNLNSKNEHGERDIFDRFFDEFIVSRSQWLRLVGKLRAREWANRIPLAFTFRHLFLNIPLRKLCVATGVSLNHEIKKGRWKL